MGLKGLSKIEPKKKNSCKFTNLAQLEAQTRLIDESDSFNWWLEPLGLTHILGWLQVTFFVIQPSQVKSRSGPNPSWPDLWTTLYIASFSRKDLWSYYYSMGSEFKYALGKVLDTQDRPTLRLASHHCVLCLNPIKN